MFEEAFHMINEGWADVLGMIISKIHLFVVRLRAINA
jgi:hypothetical protein